MSDLRPTLRILAPLAIGALLLAASRTPARAWGATGHRFISETAVKNLPADMPAFVRGADTVRLIGEIAREPDRLKAGGRAFDAEHSPGHYIYLSDDLKVLGGPPLDELPETRPQYDALLHQIGTDEYQAGYLPYSIIEGWQQLTHDFAYWRADVAAAKNAASADARDWFDKDRALHEMLIVRNLAYWSHFVADGSMPLHVSVHRMAWGDYPNPEGFTQQHSLHGRFEGAFVRKWVHAADVAAQLVPYRECACDIHARTLDYLAATHSQVIPLFELDKRHAFDSDDPAGHAFVVKQLAAGASELRDMIVDAWKASEDGTAGFPAVKVRDVENGAVDPLVELQGAD